MRRLGRMPENLTTWMRADSFWRRSGRDAVKNWADQWLGLLRSLAHIVLPDKQGLEIDEIQLGDYNDFILHSAAE